MKSSKQGAFFVFYLCIILSFVLVCALCLTKNTSVIRKKPSITVKFSPEVRLFNRHTFFVQLPLSFRPKDMHELHDAYDANRDGQYIRLYARLKHTSGTTLTVPGFAIRKHPKRPWQWEIRWSPRKRGHWLGLVTLERGNKGKKKRLVHHIRVPIQVVGNPGIQGPLIAPRGSQNYRYLRVLMPNGSSRALWLWGACRAWVIWGENPNHPWLPYEWISRKNELFPLLRSTGYNLLNQWMAPWEFLLIHRDRASYWKQKHIWKRKPYALDDVWRSYATYDQGRALAFDRLLEPSEGDAKQSTLYSLLSPIAHQNFQLREHPWGGQESGWSLENDRGKQAPSKLNGFSGYQKNMSLWSFFRATPKAPLSDRRSQLFDYQANYYRYLIARWGYSRALGVWVLMDELDAVGGVVGSMKNKTGWWKHPQAGQWLGLIFRLFRGKLVRSDGMKYQGDPFEHPLHVATTSHGGGLGVGANIEWMGPKRAKPDLFGWHWYPEIRTGTNVKKILEVELPLTIRGILRYAQIHLTAPKLISEFGTEERYHPKEAPNLLYPSLYHVGIWASILAGHAGSVMDWDDGKTFGELKWKRNNQVFSHHKKRYGLDLTLRMQAIQRFLKGAQPDLLASTVEASSPVQMTPLKVQRKTLSFVFGLYTHDRTRLWAWLYTTRKTVKVRISGMKPGVYQCEWIDPWTGKPIIALPRQRIKNASAPFVLQPEKILQRLRNIPKKGHVREYIMRGYDLAFRLKKIKSEE